MPRLIRSLEEKIYEFSIQAASLFKAGQAVKFKHNCLQNLQCFIQSVNGKRIAFSFLMANLGHPILVQVERHQLEVI